MKELNHKAAAREARLTIALGMDSEESVNLARCYLSLLDPRPAVRGVTEEMVERLAKHLCEHGQSWQGYVLRARAALTAALSGSSTAAQGRSEMSNATPDRLRQLADFAEQSGNKPWLAEIATVLRNLASAQTQEIGALVGPCPSLTAKEQKP